jgi:hypothetical protein
MNILMVSTVRPFEATWSAACTRNCQTPEGLNMHLAASFDLSLQFPAVPYFLRFSLAPIEAISGYRIREGHNG